MRKIYIVSLMLSLIIAPSWAVTKPADLKKTQSELIETKQQSTQSQKNAKALKKEILSITQSSKKMAQKTQEYEQQLLLLKDKIDALNSRLSLTRKKLFSTTSDLAGIISIMQRVSKNPENALLLYPGTPNQAIKSTALLKSLLPQINAKKQIIVAGLKELELINADLLTQKTKYESQSSLLTKIQETLSRKLKLKNILQSKTIQRSEALQAKEKHLALKIKNIKKFLARIAQEEKSRKAQIHLSKPKNIKRFPSNGKIKIPVVGRLSKRFNRRYQSGRKSTGISIKTRAKATVVAPFDGYVSYAGKFGTLGRVVIISHEGGYNSVLTGLNKIQTRTGVWLLTGEPLGSMGDVKKELYLEIRYGQKPLNPLRWINKRKIKG